MGYEAVNIDASAAEQLSGFQSIVRDQIAVRGDQKLGDTDLDHIAERQGADGRVEFGPSWQRHSLRVGDLEVAYVHRPSLLWVPDTPGLRPCGDRQRIILERTLPAFSHFYVHELDENEKVRARTDFREKSKGVVQQLRVTMFPSGLIELFKDVKDEKRGRLEAAMADPEESEVALRALVHLGYFDGRRAARARRDALKRKAKHQAEMQALEDYHRCMGNFPGRLHSRG